MKYRDNLDMKPFAKILERACGLKNAPCRKQTFQILTVGLFYELKGNNSFFYMFDWC